ncbi:putative nucleotidyltransferase [Geodermatophilus bullaregiensis]|uniref:nucleotidyltransferase domain-containing protein n=1 Tax=Geodermatophilus bullaregiensis TaxID=1564160 RepID=UPI00195AF213|nr:nucleotidyltransferase domain-containing protein [Geodermatophilus bullaregiensis]MBM7804956.1 putative nucleotidyltransferase [Geodermatophilus bullaregiensis]
MVSPERVTEVAAVLQHLTRWARRRVDVRALALVGSWAHGTPHQDSDVDVVLLTGAPEHYVHRDDWTPDLGGVRLVRTLEWGAVTERRFAVRSGLEIDLGVGTPAWASVDPVDSGTRRVVSDGMRVLHDPDGLLTLLAARLQGRP